MIQHRPWTAFLGGALVLLVITLPLLSLRLGFPDEGNNAPSQTSRQAYDQLSAGFGPGFNGPLLMVADLEAVPDRSATLTRLTDAATATEGVAFVAPSA